MEKSSFCASVIERLEAIDEILAPVMKRVALEDADNLNISAIENIGTKSKLATMILNLTKEMKSCRAVLKHGGGLVEELKGKLLTHIERESSEMKSLLEKYSDQSEQLKSIESSVKHSEKKQNLDFSKLDFSTPIKRAVKESVNKVMNDTNRNKNLIVYGVPGLGPDEGYIKYFLKDGLAFGTELIDDMVSCQRLGNDVDRDDRPILAKFNKASTVDTAIRRAQNLKTVADGEFGSIFIGRDRTAEQRLRRKELVAKKNTLIQKHPNIKWVIRNNDVVNGGTYQKTT